MGSKQYNAATNTRLSTVSATFYIFSMKIKQKPIELRLIDRVRGEGMDLEESVFDVESIEAENTDVLFDQIMTNYGQDILQLVYSYVRKLLLRI